MSETVETPNSEPQLTPTGDTPSLINGQTEQPTTEPVVEQTPEEKAAAEAATAAETARQAPITVADLVLPEGYTATDELKSEFVDTINSLSDLGPKERAEVLLNLQAKAMTAASEASSAAWNDLQGEWRKEVTSSYGDKLQPTLDSINKLVTEHGSPKLVEALAYTGAGNNPEVVKFFATMATLLTEGSYTPGSPAGGEKTAAQRLYPSMPN